MIATRRPHRRAGEADRTILRSPDHSPGHLEGMVLGTQDRSMLPYGRATLGLN
jgi:hypothetical protein